MLRTVVNEPSGTVAPAELRTRSLSTSCGSLRYWASACAGTRKVRPNRLRAVRDDEEDGLDKGGEYAKERAEIDQQRVEHVRHVDAEKLRLGAVDIEIEL